MITSKKYFIWCFRVCRNCWSSGSGKSTLMKLLWVYQPENGRFIDNYDISKVDLQSLRSQIRIVPQGYNKRDNCWKYCIKWPWGILRLYYRSRKIACAHEFIMTLGQDGPPSRGRGSNLSGATSKGTIARTILNNPNLWFLMRLQVLWTLKLTTLFNLQSGHQ